MRILKAAAALLSVAGITVSPENLQAINSGFLALYAVFSAVQAVIDNK